MRTDGNGRHTEDPIDFAADIEAVARRLCGEPNRKLCTKTELRFGSHGSLSVEIAGDKKGTWYDHERGIGGGTLDLIADKVGCNNNGAAADWFKREMGLPDPRANGHHSVSHRSGPQRQVAEYDYTDADGNLLYQVVRFDPKEFRQRHLDGDRWVWNIDGIERVPYRLPSLVAAVEQRRTIYIPEGEKDVDNLRAIGLAATTNQQGAGQWRPEFSQWLRGATVVLLPDNDETGRAHAAAIARNLSGIAASVVTVELPGLAEKGDVSDWIAKGGTAAKLEILAEAAQPPLTEGLGEWDAGDDNSPIDPRGWLLGNVFCRRYVSSIIANSGIGKTAVRIAQLLSAACGRSLVGDHVFHRARVLIVSLEDDKDELRRRVRAAMIHHGVKPEEVKGWLFLATPSALGWKLATMENGVLVASVLGDKLSATIKRLRIDIVSLDPFVKSHAVEENANNAIDFVITILANMAIELNCAVDTPHHISKGLSEPGNADRSRGASSFVAAARLVYTLAVMSQEEAQQFNVREDERKLLIRMDSAKVNITPPSKSAIWFKLVGVRIGNETQDYPSGDEVQAIERWEPPDTWAHAPSDDLNRILTELDAGLETGQRYSVGNKAADDRAAWKAVNAILPHKSEKQCKDIIATWLKTGLLVVETYDDPVARKPRQGVKVNHAKRPT